MDTLQVAGFLEHSTVNGEGFRSTLFLSGCHHDCPGCHNPLMQAFDYGESLSISTIASKIIKNAPLIDGITLSGGDPFEQTEAVYALLMLLQPLKLTTWAYTGYTYEELLLDPHNARLLPLIDVLVDGRYVASLRTETHRYIGSTNQRLLKLEEGKIVDCLSFN